jgi:hypothetical protein
LDDRRARRVLRCGGRGVRDERGGGRKDQQDSYNAAVLDHGKASPGTALTRASRREQSVAVNPTI